MDNVLTNNQATIAGEVVSNFKYSHTVYGEKFYTIYISIARSSNSHDIIPLVVSDRIVDIETDYKGCYIITSGQFRSYNYRTNDQVNVMLFVFAREIFEMEFGKVFQNLNHICVNGYVCKQPIYRKTPRGREIAEIMLAVNRAYGRADYIPCIFWGRNAKVAERFEVGTHIQIDGRIQSREYQKKIGEEEFETKVTYEVSVSKLEVLIEK